MEVGLLLLRVALALILFTHATQKLFGWFGGNGLTKQGEIFASLGLRPGRTLVATAGASELLAAALLLTGFLTPLGALMAAGTMGVAGLTMHLNSGSFWNVAGGGEYPYVLAAAATVLGFTGAGGLSADAALADAVERWGTVAAPPLWVGCGVVVLAVLTALPFAAVLRRSQQ
ncbi:DoxX family protein [Nesterenkonia ebinurensis]|uniref:DoxX family protein n=1 Tax=Nesterenkonia ebinurensis TaxID=2608252 RepID=UPI00123D3474|nr:DoxX family protein [Nesterenkonia ebinurensis]